MRKSYLFILFICSFGLLKSQTIYTYAGFPDVNGGYGGDGLVSTGAILNEPTQTISDINGNIYIVDMGNSRIRKVNGSSQIITTYAGIGGNQGYGGDGGPANLAKIDSPWGIGMDKAGNIYITDMQNQRIRKINTLGIISTIGGNGTAGFSGDGGLATLAQIHDPTAIAVDTAGNVYFCDFNYRIRKISTTGIINTIVGDGTGGFSGDGGAATSAQIGGCWGIAVDLSGNLYFTDSFNNRVRKVNNSGIINTIAGTGCPCFAGDNGPATSAGIYSPKGITIGLNGAIYIADAGNSRIRKIDSIGNIHTIAGSGIIGYSGDGGAAILAQMNNPWGVSLDAVGNIYISDRGYNTVRVICTNNCPTGIGIQELYNENKNISLSPNPFENILSISTENKIENSTLEIYNNLGQMIMKKPLNDLNTKIDLSQMEMGIYFVSIKKNEQVIYRDRVVKK